MTDQEMFDTVVITLLCQGSPSYDSYKKMSLYHNGYLRSAIGSLIPPEKYDSDMEFSSLWGLIENYKLFSYEDWLLLRDLENAHDEWYLKGFDKWKSSMKKIAKDFNLNSSILS